MVESNSAFKAHAHPIRGRPTSENDRQCVPLNVSQAAGFHKYEPEASALELKNFCHYILLCEKGRLKAIAIEEGQKLIHDQAIAGRGANNPQEMRSF